MRKLFFILAYLGVTLSCNAQMRFIPADSIITWDNDVMNLRNTALEANAQLRPQRISAPHSQLQALQTAWLQGEMEDFSNPFAITNRFTLAARLLSLTADAQYALEMERLIYGPIIQTASQPTLTSGKITTAQTLLNALGTMMGMKGDTLYVNYYANTTTILNHNNSEIQLDLITGMPFHERVKFRFSRMTFAQGIPLTIGIRLPQGEWNSATFPIYCNGHETPYRIEKGYALITNTWQSGFEIYFDLPQPLLIEQ